MAHAHSHGYPSVPIAARHRSPSHSLQKDLPVVNFIIGILNILIVLGSLFLICIILIQRGKGGGLAGAFGGVGGSSAFGTKAGDVFTRITIGVAVGWMVTAMLLVVLTNRRASSRAVRLDDDADLGEPRICRPRSRRPSPPAPGPGTRRSSRRPRRRPTPAPGAPPIPTPVDIPAIPDEPAQRRRHRRRRHRRPRRRPRRPRRRHRPRQVGSDARAVRQPSSLEDRRRRRRGKGHPDDRGSAS